MKKLLLIITIGLFSCNSAVTNSTPTKDTTQFTGLPVQNVSSVVADAVVAEDTVEQLPDYLYYYEEVNTGDEGYFLADKGAYKIGDLTTWTD